MAEISNEQLTHYGRYQKKPDQLDAVVHGLVDPVGDRSVGGVPGQVGEQGHNPRKKKEQVRHARIHGGERGTRTGASSGVNNGAGSIR